MADDAADQGLSTRRGLSMGQKYIGLSVTLLALMLAAAVYSFVQANSASDETRLLAEVIEPLDHELNDLAQNASGEALSVERALRYGGPQINDPARAGEQASRFATFSGRVGTDLSRLARHIAAYQATAPRTDIAVALSRLDLEVQAVKREHRRYNASVTALLRAGTGKPSAAIRELEAHAQQQETALIAAIERMTLEAQTLAVANEARASRTMSRSLLVSRENLVLAIAAFLAGSLLSFLFTRRMVGRVHRLIRGTQEVRRGNLEVSLPAVAGDEIEQLTNAFAEMIGELRSKAAMRQTFGHYMDPRVVDRLLGDDRALLEAGERRTMTVFFSDLQEFSAISETLTPTSLVKLINRHLSLVSEPIREHQGVIDKYIGDGVMAYWGEPFTQGDHVLNACRAALAQRRQADMLRAELPELLGLRRGAPDVHVRIGLATGDVVVGSIGSPTSKSFTIMGDTVNIASRLEGANKAYGTMILADEATIDCVRPQIEARELDIMAAVGKSEPVRIFELLGERGDVEPGVLESRDAFEAGLAAYRAGDWETATARFGECGRLAPGDVPARLFLERVRVFRATPPGPDWAGVWVNQVK
ncbi:MAG: adenylate/guanylate cyclase protein [Sphingomonas bacterium]|uniref:adenylate/guanylate cyclase domain-containing protein n=1 Tax=Sphingomonas bacterium TaxID=1895847 RepID=UPI00261E77D3|nr:adenylate/guanylate cyclase domain-containing protein [Sphingomonas bacterium]MDB5707719.1 adenylate/guanylate cyclase protein [Sphingomonas bacterium]